MNHPLLLLALTGAGVWLFKLWRDDVRAAQTGRPNPNAFPGAAPAPLRASLIAVAGSLLLLAGETAGEYALGISDQQAKLTWLFALYSMLAAPVIEEVIFRGWLGFDRWPMARRWAGAVAASVLFALLHPFLWRWDDAGFAVTANLKGWFSFGVVFLASLWFYAARLGPWNPQGSLLPCFAAHAAKNVGVVAIKAATGHMAGLW
jgi:membrane protease YdiL (CAAX protease family)